MIIEPIYRCPVCRNEYETEEEAVQCYNSTPEPEYEVGQIVVFNMGHTWYDGQENWIESETDQYWKHHQGRVLKSYRFYAVITDVSAGDRNQSPFSLHRVLYSVQSLACKQFKGWTDPEQHIKFEVVDNPPESVVEESKALLGAKFYNLL